MDEQAKAARRAYQREWAKNNRDRLRAAQERFWRKRAKQNESEVHHMVSSYKVREANRALKAILTQYKESYDASCKASREAYLQTLPAGSSVPADGRIYGDAAREEFNGKCWDLRAEAKKILDDLSGELRNRVAEAPSADAVNTLTLLNMRHDVTEDEIAELAKRFDNNPQAWKTLKSIAEQNKIHVLREHPIETSLHQLEDIEQTLDSNLNVFSAERGHTSPGFLAMLETQIDNALPEE